MKKVRVGTPSEVVGLFEHIDQLSFYKGLNDYVDSLIPGINIDALGAWRLLINVNSRNTDLIGFYKRSIRYPSDCEFEISIAIPIPSRHQAAYGFAEPARPPFYRPIDPSKFYTLDPNFDQYHDMNDYALDAGKRAIDLAFTKGFTCNGKKIKFQHE